MKASKGRDRAKTKRRDRRNLSEASASKPQTLTQCLEWLGRITAPQDAVSVLRKIQADPDLSRRFEQLADRAARSRTA